MKQKISPRPCNKRLIACMEPPIHKAVEKVLLQSYKKKEASISTKQVVIPTNL